MKDAYYFSHDANARNDPRMLLLRARHGVNGYGTYFMIVEMLREESEHKLDAVEPDLLYSAIALGVAESVDKVTAIVKDCIKFGLLRLEGGRLFSESLLRRMEMMAEISGRRAVAGRKGGMAKAAAYKQEYGNAVPNAKQNPGKPLAVKESKERKLNKEYLGGQAPTPIPTKIGKVNGFTPPSLEEVTAYCQERQNTVDAARWHDFYAAKGWAIGKNRMKDWRAAVRTWERSEEGLAKAAAKVPQIMRCFNCMNAAAVGAKVCATCAWCVDCDTARRESRRPPGDLEKSPAHGRPVCKDCAWGAAAS